MSVTVGTLIVDLQANTASFVEGLDKAGQISLTSAKKIERALTAMSGIVIGALTAVEAAFAEMADKAIENAARLYDVAQATGVSVEALSGLEYVAKQSGVAQEALDTALEKMARSMEKAASSSHNSTNAYKTLGVQVTDLNGRLRPTEEVIADLADKFSRFKDGPEKTALAMQIFGKAGAELVPLLNRGKDGITDLLAEAKKLGIVIDPEMAEASKHFEESMNKIKAAAEGATNKIVRDTLPQIQLLADNVSEGLDETQGRFAGLMEGLSVLGKAFVVVFGAIQASVDSAKEAVGKFIEEFGNVLTTLQESEDLAAGGNIRKAVDRLRKGQQDQEEIVIRSAQKQSQIWKDYTEGVKEFWDATVQHVANNPLNKQKDQAPKIASEDSVKFAAQVEEKIRKLEAEADAVAKDAAAQQGYTASTIAATAADEAAKIIAELNAVAHEKHAAAIGQLAEARIKAAVAEKVFAAAANELSKSLGDDITKTTQQIAAVKAMATAYREGGEAITVAQEKARIEPFTEKVRVLEAAFDKLTQSGTATAAQIEKMGRDLAQAKTEYEAVANATRTLTLAEQAANSDRMATDQERQVAAMVEYRNAVLQGAEAVRQFNIQQQTLAYIRNPNTDHSMQAVAQYVAGLELISDATKQNAAVEKIAALANLQNIQDEIDQLRKYRAENKLTAEQELAYDALIHDAELKKLQDQDALLLKTGGVGAGIKVFFDEYTHDGVSAAQRVHDVMKETTDQFVDTLASGLAKGKLDFANFAESIEQMLFKLSLNKILQSIFNMGSSGGQGGIGGIFSNILGGLFGGHKAGGGPVDPYHVYEVGERGREWFVPNTPGVIVPQVSSPSMGAASGSRPIVISQNFNISTPDANSFRRSRSQIESEMYRGAVHSHTRLRQ